MEKVQPHDVPHISCVGINIPNFWPEDPTVWFVQLKASLASANFTQDFTKYYYVNLQLDGPVIKDVKDIVSNPLKTGKFDKLKTKLIECLSSSQE